MKIILDEYPLLVMPSLATAIGLNEALFLQRLHYWLKNSAHSRDGRKWVYNTVEAWREQFPFWSEKTIRRIVESLREKGLVETTQSYNQKRYDKTLWFSINYHILEEMEVSLELKASGQNDQTLAKASGQNDHMHVDKMTRPIPKNTQRIKSSSSLFATTADLEPQNQTGDLPAKQKTPKKSPPQNLSEHAWLTRWWCYAFERITGSRYAFGAKDAKLIKGLLTAPGFDETLDRACAYLLMPEAKRWPKGAPTLGGLQMMINQLAGKFDGEAEAKAIRAGLLPDDDATIGYCGYWTPWEKAA
ncbi:MAG: hypothetical protein ACYC9I_11510 [Desulfuromonadales bacterium]